MEKGSNHCTKAPGGNATRIPQHTRGISRTLEKLPRRIISYIYTNALCTIQVLCILNNNNTQTPFSTSTNQLYTHITTNTIRSPSLSPQKQGKQSDQYDRRKRWNRERGRGPWLTLWPRGERVLSA